MGEEFQGLGDFQGLLLKTANTERRIQEPPGRRCDGPVVIRHEPEELLFGGLCVCDFRPHLLELEDLEGRALGVVAGHA